MPEIEGGHSGSLINFCAFPSSDRSWWIRNITALFMLKQYLWCFVLSHISLLVIIKAWEGALLLQWGAGKMKSLAVTLGKC